MGKVTLSDFYTWDNVTATQWCTSGYSPNLTTGINILYGPVTTGTPSSMPEQYINGDVPGFKFVDGTVTPVPGITVIANYTDGRASLLGSYAIYTWDSTSAKRGTGGNPTKACQGDPITQ